MSKRKTSIITASLLATALFAASPALMAGNSYGSSSKHHDGQRNMSEMCDNLREGKGKYNMEERQAEMAKRHEAMAERLKLNDEQRGIWNEMHEERRQQHEKRMSGWEKKMKKRCAQPQE
ncbi:hypothetical protein [Marinobacter sp.]|uniref:hypothetical protein n=1 Tax=Marinobacter sp. TaxID=50741 RepID=UPI003A90408C